MRIGSIVHYGAVAGPCVAAMVTDAREVGGGKWEVRLCLFPADAFPTPLEKWIAEEDVVTVARGFHSRAQCAR